MNSTKKLKEAFDHSEKKEFSEALKICSEVIENYPKCTEAYRERAYVYSRMKDWEKALLDINKAITLDLDNPADYFTRGRWLLITDNPQDAVEDFSKVLMIENEMNSAYFSETAYFFRALAYLDIGLYEKALNDCKEVRDDFALHFKSRLRSKREIQDFANSKLSGG